MLRRQLIVFFDPHRLATEVRRNWLLMRESRRALKRTFGVPLLLGVFALLIAVSQALRDSGDLRVAAAEPASQSNSPSPISELIAALESDDAGRQVEALTMVGDMGPAARPTLPYVLPLLGHADDSVRDETLRALVKIGPGAVPDLVRVLKAGNARSRESAAMVLGAIKPAPYQAIEPLAEALEDDEPAIRVAAAKALSHVAPSLPQAFRPLASALHNDSSDVRQTAAEAMIELAPLLPEDLQPHVINGLILIAGKDPGLAQRSAMRALARFGVTAEHAIPALASALEDPDKFTRADAADALGSLGPKAIEPLLRATHDPEQLVRVTAVEALGRIGRPAAEALVEAIKEGKDDQTVASAIDALGSIAPSSEVEVSALIDMLKSPVSLVGESAAAALGRVANHEAVVIQALVEVVESPDLYPTLSEPSAVSLASLAVQIQDHEATELLPELKSAESSLESSPDHIDELAIIRRAIRALEALRSGRDWWTFLGLSLAGFHTFVFLFLIVASRWSTWCFKVLTDPVWGKTGVWFYFFLRHFRWLQIWLFERYFCAMRNREEELAPYLSMPLTAEDGLQIESKNMLDVVKIAGSKTWIQGNAGMGKTAMLDHLRSQFFCAAGLTSLRAAYGWYNFVPVFVPVRAYRAVTAETGGDEPQDWVANVTQAALAGAEMPFADKGLFRGILKSGAFAIFLDGLNEVERDEAVHLFARTTPSVRLLVTSQTGCHAPFECYFLPQEITAFMSQMLRLYLGEAEGSAFAERVINSGLMGSIRSGYDVRLLVDLYRRGEVASLPQDRLSLYGQILGSVRMADQSPLPEERVAEAAWRLWRDGRRRLREGADLSPDLIAALGQEDQKILRSVGQGVYEFRHDQFRAYLAARWAAVHVVSPEILFEREAQIWMLGRKEQDEVWSFFAEMMDESRAQAIWRFATEHQERVVLQHAVQNVASSKGWQLSREPDLKIAV